MKKTIFRMVNLCILFMIILSSLSIVHAGRVSRTNQDATAYVGGSITASGKTPKVGYCAVHPAKRGTHSNPIIPFGTVINITEIRDPATGKVWDMIPHPYYGEMNSLQVQDIGDVNYRFSTHWIDIWYGNSSFLGAAKDFGTRKINYSYYN